MVTSRAVRFVGMLPRVESSQPLLASPAEAAATVAGAAAGALTEATADGSPGPAAAASAEVERELAQQAGVVTAANAAISTGGASGASAALPGMLADVPVAVLVIDQRAGTVVYANTAAVELAGNVQLPVDLDSWGAAAGLTDLDGEPLAGTRGPLSLVAQGQPVAGEPVRLSGAGATADDTGADRLLWVTGFPLSRADSGQRLALVVFLRAPAEDVDDPAAQLQALRERAVLATDTTFTITDPRRPDDPLVWVNPSFSRLTGYSADEVVGRNCRILQGPGTDPAAVAEIRAALRARRPVTTTLLNYRKDGTPFWNQLSVNPVFDGEKQLVSFVGVQTDVTERVRGDREREAAFTAERTARQDAERAREIAEQAQARLALMAEATSALTVTLDIDELIDQLAWLCVPVLADWAFITLVDPAGQVTRTAFRHREGRRDELEELSARHAFQLPAASPSRRSMATRRPVLVPEVTEEFVEATFTSARSAELFRQLGATSMMAVPLVARRQIVGALALVMAADGHRATTGDVELAEDLARRAALALDNVRLYQQEHTVAETLQRSLLPELPVIAGIEAAAHYISASAAAAIGGDFYDLLQLADGSIGMVIGDVVGHDLAAAAAMGHLRGLIRACAWDAPDPAPDAVLARVDRLVQGLGVAAMATMVYVRALRPAGPGAPWRLQIANAGHPPLLLRRPDGRVQVLDEVGGLLVGVDDSARRRTLTLEVPAGTIVLGYTDGLIERPGLDLDQGIDELVQRLAAAPVGAGPQLVCDAATSAQLDRRDDIALIAVRLD